MPTGNMDPYVYPGTNVLKNLRDIRDPERLSKFEMDMTTRRLSELARIPMAGQFSAQHLQAMHGYVFQDVYGWAGEFRTVNISRSGQFPFAFAEHIVPTLNKLSDDLAAEHHLSRLTISKFSNRAAHYLGELNAVHPFRDGNGRTQREFIRQLAGRNGYALDWSKVAREQMLDASKESFQRGNNAGLENVLKTALDNEQNRRRERERDAGDER